MKHGLVRSIVLMTFLMASIAMAQSAPTQTSDPNPWQILAGVCSVLLAVVGFVVVKIDKNQTRLFELHADHTDKIAKVEKDIVEIRTGIEFCATCNSHRHHRATD